MTAIGHVATADCERCRPGPIAQPVNTASSLAFCVAGAVLIRRHRGDRAGTALGWSAVAAGLGSVAYHGPGTRAGAILHDASLITLLGTVAATDVARVAGRELPTPVLRALPAAAIAAAASPFSMPAQLAVGAGAVVAEWGRVRSDRHAGRRGWRPFAEAVVAGVGALGHVLGRTDGPLCRPDSRWQAHALWHTAMAVALVLRDDSAERRRGSGDNGDVAWYHPGSPNTATRSRSPWTRPPSRPSA